MKKIEERLARLEELADRIKEPELPLEDAMAVFEEGIKISKSVQKDLDRIQGKIEILLGADEDASKPELGLFDEES
jgi:exodeoxyribonuclease VII small subunit